MSLLVYEFTSSRGDSFQATSLFTRLLVSLSTRLLSTFFDCNIKR
nr:MAG TPA: hypothetical protein [Caudoviricetes sp.]